MRISKSIVGVETLLGLTILSGAILSAPKANADSSAAVDITVNVPAACSLTPATSSLSKTINPGNSAEIGTTHLKAICNDPSGFAIYAVGYTNDQLGNTDLVNNLDNNYKIATGLGTSGDSNWNMTIGTDSGAYAANIVTGFDTPHVIPFMYTKIAYLPTSTDQSIGSNLTARFDAYIAPSQAAGTYQGKVKYLLVHPNIPDKYLSGEDENGPRVYTGEDVIKEEDLPATAISHKMAENQIDENRRIDVYLDYEGQYVNFGDEVSLIAVLHGYENCIFTVQWQHSTDDENYEDIEGANEFIYKFVVTRENYTDFWRIVATITAIEVPD